MSETLALSNTSLITDFQDILAGSTPTSVTPEATQHGVLADTVEGMMRWMCGDIDNPADMSVITRTRTTLGRWSTSAMNVKLVTPAAFANEHLLPFTRGAAKFVQGVLTELSLVDDRTGGCEIRSTDITSDGLLEQFNRAASVIASHPLPDTSPVEINLEVLEAKRLKRQAELAGMVTETAVEAADRAALLAAEEGLHAA